jgi:hypothetical protein
MIDKLLKSRQGHRVYIDRGQFAKRFDRQKRIVRAETLEAERLESYADVSQPEARIAAFEAKDGERVE